MPIFEPDWELEKRLEEKEPPYRSKGEAQVGRLLDRYGIPFEHEKPLLVDIAGKPQALLPDFTLIHHNNLVIEYAGAIGKPDYFPNLIWKKSKYIDNYIDFLFLFPKDITGPQWPELLYRKIRGAIDAYDSLKKKHVSNP